MFSVPYNQNKDVKEVYLKYKDIIQEVYFPASPLIINSARKIEWNEESEKNNEELVVFLKENGIESELLMNSICDERIFNEETLADIVNYVYKYHLLGLNAVSVSNPILFKAIVDNVPDIRVCLSILSNVFNIDQIKKFYEYGAREICLQPHLTRSKTFIKKVKELMPDMRIKMMANCFCSHDCIAFMQHHIEVSCGRHESDQKYFDYICNQDKENPLRKNIIFPNEIDYYDYVDIFKISGRQFDNDRLDFVLGKYKEKKSYGYNLTDLLDGPSTNTLVNVSYVNDFRSLDQISDCNYKCVENGCSYCDNILNKYFYFERKED